MDGTTRLFGEKWKCGGDGMVKIELEAAQTLAALADFESVTKETVDNEGDSVPVLLDLHQDQPALVEQCHEKICDEMNQPVTADQYADPMPNPVSTTGYASSGSSKPRKKLTEAEKESRRLRRVLANRESARQTIRRRQAVYEELTRKATDLVLENENLKREKESAMKEYEFLRSTNECLKAEMAKIESSEVEVTREESTSVEMTTFPSTSCPVFVYNQPSFLQFVWSPFIQPLNSAHLQCGPQSATAIPQEVPKLDSYNEQENPTMLNNPRPPLYVLPYPWLFPYNQTQSLNPNGKQNDTSHDIQCSVGSSLKPEETRPLFLPVKVETDAIDTTTTTSSVCENHFGFPPDGGGSHPRGGIHVAAPLTVEGENNSHTEPTCDVKSVSLTLGPSEITNGLPEKKEEPVICTSKKVDALAAAEARRKRKELTKIKNLHCRQFRIHP